MKKLILSLVLIITACAGAGAQETRNAEKPSTSETSKKAKGDIFKELNLSEEQKTKLKIARENVRNQLVAINNNTELTDDQKKQQKNVVRKNHKAAVEKILSPEQIAKMKELQKERKTKTVQNKENKRKNREEIKKELAISNDQTNKLKSIKQETKSKVVSIKQNKDLSDESKKTEIKKIREDAKAQRKSVLTPDQQKKLQEIKAKRKTTKSKENIKS